MSRRRTTITSLILVLLALLYQNCSQKTSSSTGENSGSTQHIVIGSTSPFDTVTFSSRVNFSSDPYKVQMGEVTLTVDLLSGSQESTDHQGSRHCTVDESRLKRLRQIMNESYICEPGPLPPDSAQCLAIGAPDIELSNDSDSIILSPLICHFGTYLCDGKDELFRSLLVDLRDNPPSDCTP